MIQNIESPRVFVVIGTEGEYSDREVWVAGVYVTHEEAKTVAERAFRDAREAYAVLAEWTKRRAVIRDSSGKRYWYLSHEEQAIMDKRVDAAIGPQPAKTPGVDGFTVVEVPIGVFGVWKW